MRHATGKLDYLLSASDFTEGIRENLAVLAGDNFGKLALALVEQLAKLKHDLLTLSLGHVFPGDKRFFSCRNRSVDFAFVCQRYLLGDDTKCWVIDRCRSTRVARYMFIGNPVANNRLRHFSAFFAAALTAFSIFCNSISARRTRMSFFTRVFGSGLSIANCMLPFDTT